MGADHVLNSSDPAFETRLRELCHDLGAHLAFESVAGPLSGQIPECAARRKYAHRLWRIEPATLCDPARRIDLPQKAGRRGSGSSTG
ncbi:hypothetical protein [Candidatus Flexifilum breve]|uniref:hypothetical protein n=1 Tax=Candidatus Flexifilum breve TaxID=3140694 RepID=UPI00331304DD